VLLAGTITVGTHVVYVGLALRTDEPNNIGRVTIDYEQWLDVLGIRDLPG
jgi:hypothetical protein